MTATKYNPEDLREFTSVQPVVEYDDILAAVTVEPDEDAQAPWEHSDGWNHELVNDPSDTRGAGSIYYQSARQMIRLTDPETWGNFEAFRESGASKQVAYERTREIQREAIEQIKRWYRNGWEVWGVVCKFKGFHASVWGVYDDDGDYVETVKKEIADEVVRDMEIAGYMVQGKPVAKPRNHVHDRLAWRLKNKQHGLDEQNWQGPVRRRRR